MLVCSIYCNYKFLTIICSSSIHSFDQSDGQKHVQDGELRNAGSEDEFIAMKGSYSWVGPDGVTYTVNYVADENGYQPTIEQGPGGAVPSAVVASLLG